jgi:hypothetical protein
MSEIGAIGKDKKNQQQGFMYRGVDDVMNTLQPLLVKHRVFIVPEVLEQSREEKTTKTGGTLIYSICKIKYTFFTDDGTNIVAIVVGEGMDSGDKATNKAMSIAFKYVCFQVFCIPTEEMADPDGESHEFTPGDTKPKEPPSKPAIHPQQNTRADGDTISPAQAKRMFAIAHGKNDIVKAAVKKYGYEKSEQIKKVDYEKICKEIEEVLVDNTDYPDALR